jgi:hypothetical protein
MPNELLKRIDSEAERLGKTRSEYLQEAGWQQLGWPAPEVIEAALAKGRAALEGIGSFDVVAEIRALREER